MFLTVNKISSNSFVVLKLLMKIIGDLFLRLFIISLLTFRYFPTIVSLFGAGARPFFYGSGSGSGSGSKQTV